MDDGVKLRVEDCCGCGLCVALCPVNAIIMKADKFGFVYPLISKDKCIHCGVCINKCIFNAR